MVARKKNPSGKPALSSLPKKAPLYNRVRDILEQARQSSARSVNTSQVLAYWMIGREIVEEEQDGSKRAGCHSGLSFTFLPRNFQASGIRELEANQ